MPDSPDNQQPSPDDKLQQKASPEEAPPTYSSPTGPIIDSLNRVYRGRYGLHQPSLSCKNLPSPLQITTTSNASLSPHIPAFKTKPTNFLVLSSDQYSIRGEFAIDPSIHIPSSVLPPLSRDETKDDRKNLSLRSRDGSVHADIWLLGLPTKRRATIALASIHGSIHTQLRTMGGASFALTATAPHGSVKLDLPRSFTGLLILTTRHGSIKLSEGLLQQTAQLGQHGATRRYFIGDLGLLGDQWEGNQVEVEVVHGSIRLRYVDEEGRKGLFSQLFARM